MGHSSGAIQQSSCKTCLQIYKITVVVSGLGKGFYEERGGRKVRKAVLAFGEGSLIMCCVS